jgi:LAO/AO transport system kinase
MTANAKNVRADGPSARNTADSVARGISKGNRLSLARLLSWEESGDPRADEVRGVLPERWARVVGITGPPGAGKSSLVDTVVHELRRRGETVGIIAVDPSSARHGGALLGDRVRMTRHTFDEGVFIRSMANRGQVGGTAAAVPGAINAMASFGLDWVLVETVGVGQAEIDVARQTDCVVVMVAPGAGDDVQAIKSGVMEIADVFVVNKSDRPDAEHTIREVTAAIRLRRTDFGVWRPPVVATSAEKGTGVMDLLEQIGAHLDHSDRSGVLADRRQRQRMEELRTRLIRGFASLADEICGHGPLGAIWRDAALSGATTPAAAASDILRDIAQRERRVRVDGPPVS